MQTQYPITLLYLNILLNIQTIAVHVNKPSVDSGRFLLFFFLSAESYGETEGCGDSSSGAVWHHAPDGL